MQLWRAWVSLADRQPIAGPITRADCRLGGSAGLTAGRADQPGGPAGLAGPDQPGSPYWRRMIAS